MTVDQAPGGAPKHDVVAATLNVDCGDTKVEQLTVVLKLPGAKLAALGSPDQQNGAEKSIEHTQLDSEEEVIDVLPTHRSPDPDERQDDQQMADAESSPDETTSNSTVDLIKREAQNDEALSDRPFDGPLQPTARADSDMEEPIEDVQSILEEAKSTTGVVSNMDQTIQLNVVPNPIPENDIDAIMKSSPPSTGPSVEQSKTERKDNAADSDGHLTDAELVVVETSATCKDSPEKQQQEEEPQDQVPGKEYQSVQDIQSYGMTPALLQRSQAAVASLQNSRQQVMQREGHPIDSQKPQSLGPSVNTLELNLELKIQQLEFQTQQRKEALAAARAEAQAVSGTFGQGRLSMASALPAPIPLGPLQQLGTPYSHPSYAAQGYPQMGSHYPTYGYYGHTQMPHSMAQAHYPPNYTSPSLHGMLPGSNGTMNREQYHQASQTQQFQLQQNVSAAQRQHQQAQYSMGHSESDSEDLALKLRPRPHSSAQQQGSSIPLCAPPKISFDSPLNPNHPDDSNIDVLPKSIAQSSSTSEIDFTLPRYEVQRQPLEKKEDIPSAKVSLPGLVREELLLSPDHADQEVHLLLSLFLPNQQLLTTPDPEPAAAVLNFHNIAVMVIEAFVQFEIGDEFGTGRGHWHNDHDDDGEGEYVRVRDAKDANPDDIFFAVIDRWRAGIESGRKGVLLIRGAQEFCDVALDIIYYVKENGLLRPDPKGRKGKGKGKEKAGEEGDGGEKGKKRGAQKVVNEVQPRKKAKTTPTKGKPKAKVIVSKPVMLVKKR